MKASRKIQALGRIFPYKTINRKITLSECLFNISIWLLSFNLDEPQKNTQQLHKRAINLVYNNFSSSFSELLEKDICNYTSL